MKTHTLRHVVESNPGGKFPLKIGSICILIEKLVRDQIYQKTTPIEESLQMRLNGGFTNKLLHPGSQYGAQQQNNTMGSTINYIAVSHSHFPLVDPGFKWTSPSSPQKNTTFIHMYADVCVFFLKYYHIEHLSSFAHFQLQF